MKSSALLLLVLQFALVNSQDNTTTSVQNVTNAYDCFADRDDLYSAISEVLYDANPNDTETATRYGPIETWCVDQVTDFSGLFKQANTMNYDLSQWKTGQVTDMSELFFRAEIFDQNLSSWDVSSVQNFENTFAFCYKFLGNGLEHWNVSSGTTLLGMFSSASTFSADISQWDVSRVVSLENTFALANAFDADLSAWDVSSVTSMSALVANASLFDSDISGWDVSKVRSMDNAFRNATSFNADLSGWNVTQVMSFEAMFQNAWSFNVSLCEWGPQLSPMATVVDMFASASSCPSLDSPDLMATPIGPLCYFCGENGGVTGGDGSSTNGDGGDSSTNGGSSENGGSDNGDDSTSNAINNDGSLVMLQFGSIMAAILLL